VHYRLITLAVLVITAGAGCSHNSAPQERSAHNESSVFHELPKIGLAVLDESARWCAEFVSDSTHSPLEAGRRVTIVFAGNTPMTTRVARIIGPQDEQCPAAFAQPRWIDYQAYRLELVDSESGAATTAPVALVVASEARWEPGSDGIVRADLDGDGTPEEARRCAADEGEHFTIWSVTPANAPTRRWHEYYDWGALVDPTCKPGEDGL